MQQNGIETKGLTVFEFLSRLEHLEKKANGSNKQS